MTVDTRAVTYEVLEGPNPYELYEELRTHAPVMYVEELGRWLVTSWDACEFVAKQHASVAGNTAQSNEFFGTPNVLTLSGPEHRFMRAGIDAELRPRVVRRYVDDLSRQTVINYIERIRPLGAADLTTDLFERISVRVIGNKLGLTDVDDDTLVRWFKTLSEGSSTFTREIADAQARADRTKQEIETYLTERVEELHDKPDSSIISHMIHTGTEDGAPRTYEEIAPSIRVIILGGFQEPGFAVANTFNGLFRNPVQLAQLAEAPEQHAQMALEEGLRWIAPIGKVDRTATADINTPWGTINAGDEIALAVGAANRDRARFDHADEYDFARMTLPHATFGYGEHFCAGHALARGLAQIVIEETVQRLPGLRPDPTGEATVEGFSFRGTKHLPALWNA